MATSPAVTELCENSNEVFLDVATLLLKYADNILRFPNEEKHRSIRIGNATFSTKLLPVKGAVECLFEMGFEEDETHLVFPKSASMEQLKFIRDSLASEKNQRLQEGQPASLSPASQTLLTAASNQPVSPHPENAESLSATLNSKFDHVLVYENPELQQKALRHIPQQQLSSTAKDNLKKAKKSDPDCKLGIEDFLVLDLLRWFNQDFFTWVDSLSCSRCGGSTEIAESLSPSTEDLQWGADRVENHYCQPCGLSMRFPRYNNPEKLLETRRGRCGEWANCFTLCCRALGLEARYIWDSTDHVWTEIYSVAQHRWLHCDSCENVCDNPLLYEMGWGKKLSYILAFSKDQVVDVTWRYSCKHPEVLSRRTAVSEPWLRQSIEGLNVHRQQFLGQVRTMELTKRLLVELVEFISPKKPKPGELGGRNSGSLAWRMARGETRAAESDSSTHADGFLFTPTEKEKSDGLLHVYYNAAKDQYCRLSNNSEVVQGWDRCLWRKESIFRKVEDDWQMVYLARTEGSTVGHISWRFDFNGAGMRAKSVSVKASSQTFNSGKVCLSVQSAATTAEFSGDGKIQLFPSLSGSSDFTIVAELTGGDGVASWQHSQLFRQGLKDRDDAAFEILIHLEDA